jgi:hypothetical protein
MSMLCRTSTVLALVCSAMLIACGAGHAGSQSCRQDKECPAGQGCLNNVCAPLACGGCQPEEACGTDGKCVPAQGASCVNHTCPPAYPCNGTVCAKPCTVDKDCDIGLVCNSQVHSCAECSFNSQCAAKAGRPVCDTDPSAGALAASGAGLCVACNVNFDCTKALGSGHYCDGHICKTGCKIDGDCNQSQGEKCDTSVTPGKCIQCKVSADCAAQGPGAQACDNTGHCVQCYGSTQATANAFCGAGTPECNLANKTCVQCLPANNQSGADCGYLIAGSMDPHDATTCDPGTFSCVPGCKFDEQCGCPRNGPGGTESNCQRKPDQEHCDPSRTTMVGVTGTTQGACVQCYNDNKHCAYKVMGSAQYGGAYASLNGSRCMNDSCVEGCDTDNDCPSGRICHIGTSSSDPNNHKCVECKCDVPGIDPTWCDTTAAGTAACANDTGGNPRVCDAATLLCRKKRMGEECSKSNECGDTHDPTIGACLPTPAMCVYHSHSGSNVGGETYCFAGGLQGRCGVPCDGFFNNSCVQGTASCPPNSSCRQATNEAGAAGAYCVASKCNCTATACP